MNIYLIGLSGSGKTTIGKKLSDKLGMDFIDTDEYINFKSQLNPGDFIKKYGEKAFRLIEKKALKDILSSSTNFVVATGGGLPAFYNNIDTLLETGRVIYLKVSPEISFKRIKDENLRPLSMSLDNVDYLYNKRKNIYEKAHIVIDAKPSLDKVVNEIISKLSSFKN
ncbi:MAG: shikimate kinase [Clostridium sp.]|nr:shikimate kinase [Clostridium sp.]